METRVRGVAPKNTTAVRPESWVSSTLRWGSWQVYDRTAVDRLVGLDYFGARYYSAAMGRWTSADPYSILLEAGSREELDAFLAEPQRWNKYTYSLHDPLKYVDPDGNNPVLMQLLQRLSPYGDKAAAAAQRWGAQVGQAASRYGQQAYVWATQFFNSPTGQEATAAAAELVTGAQLPYGFNNVGQFQQFSRAVSGGLREAAGGGLQAFLGGSAITGQSFRTGAAFDVGRTSDFDIAVVGGNLLAKAKELGIELRSKGTRTGPLDPQALKALGLDKLAQQLSQQAGRKVSFMIYESEEALRQRGTPYLGLQ
jgi:RHS repeat-associated protein